MDPSLEGPSSPTNTQPPTRRHAYTGGREIRCGIKRLKNSRPKKTDEEDLDVQTAGIKR